MTSGYNVSDLNEVLYALMADGQASSFHIMCQRRSRGVWTSGKEEKV